MTAIVLVMHEPLASSFAHCARHILGEARGLTVHDIGPDADPDIETDRLTESLMAQTDGPILLLSDIVGATPFNIASRVLAGVRARGKTAELLAGANLCMLLKALTTERPTFEAMVASVRDGGQRGIVRVDAPSISFHDRGSDSLID